MSLDELPPELLALVTNWILGCHIVRLRLCGSNQLSSRLNNPHAIHTWRVIENRATDITIPPWVPKIENLRVFSINSTSTGFYASIRCMNLLDLPKTLECIDLIVQNGEEIYWDGMASWEKKQLKKATTSSTCVASASDTPKSDTNPSIPSEIPPDDMLYPFPKLKELRIGNSELPHRYFLSESDVLKCGNLPQFHHFPPLLEILETRSAKLPSVVVKRNLPQNLKHLILHGRFNSNISAADFINWSLKLPKCLHSLTQVFRPVTVKNIGEDVSSKLNGEIFLVEACGRNGILLASSYVHIPQSLPSSLRISSTEKVFAAEEDSSQKYALLEGYSFLFPPFLTRLDLHAENEPTLYLSDNFFKLLPRTLTWLRALGCEFLPSLLPLLPESLLHLWLGTDGISQDEHIANLPRGLQTLSLKMHRSHLPPTVIPHLPRALTRLSLDLEHVPSDMLAQLPPTITELDLGNSASFDPDVDIVLGATCPLLRSANLPAALNFGGKRVRIAVHTKKSGAQSSISGLVRNERPASELELVDGSSPRKAESRKSLRKSDSSSTTSNFTAFHGTGVVLGGSSAPSSPTDCQGAYIRSHRNKRSGGKEHKDTTSEPKAEQMSGSHCTEISPRSFTTAHNTRKRQSQKKQTRDSPPTSFRYPSLQELDINDSETAEYQNGQESLDHPKDVRLDCYFSKYLLCLDLKYNRSVQDGDIEVLPRSLIQLKLTWNSNLTNSCASSFPPNLTLLDLAGTTQFTDKAVSKLPRSLLELNLASAAQISGSSFSSLPPNLTSLNLRNSKSILDRHITHLPRTIVTLVLYSAFNITDKGLAHLPPYLSSLDLSWSCSITDKGVPYLPRYVTELNLHNAEKFTASMLPHLPLSLTSFTCASYFPPLESIRSKLPPQLHNFNIRR